MTPAAADVVHVLVATALTYALGFERDLRGAPAGDRVFALIGVGAGIVGVLAAHGAPTALQGALTGIGFIGAGLVFRQEQGHLQMIRGLTTAAAIFAVAAIGAAAGEGRLVLATAATAFALLVLEIRHIRLLRPLDGRRWASRFHDDESPGRPWLLWPSQALPDWSAAIDHPKCRQAGRQATQTRRSSAFNLP